MKFALANSDFWINARVVLKLADPVIKALGVLERDGCCLSMIYDRFRMMMNHDAYVKAVPEVSNTVKTKILELVTQRWTFVSSDSMYVAFLLDPSKTINAFDGNDLLLAINAAMALVGTQILKRGVQLKDVRQQLMSFVRMKQQLTTDEQKNKPRTLLLIGGRSTEVSNC